MIEFYASSNTGLFTLGANFEYLQAYTKAQSYAIFQTFLNMYATCACVNEPKNCMTKSLLLVEWVNVSDNVRGRFQRLDHYLA